MVFLFLSKFYPKPPNLHLALKVKKKKKSCGSLASPAWQLPLAHFVYFPLLHFQTRAMEKRPFWRFWWFLCSRVALPVMGVGSNSPDPNL